MNQYQNPHVGVSVEFPDNWNFRYWGNRKGILVNPELYQASFDDLPSKDSPHKVLLTSFRHFEKGPSLLNGLLELVALYRPNGINLESEIPVNSSEISRNYGKYILAGNSSIFLHSESRGESCTYYTRYYYWQFKPNVWLGCLISANSHEKFNEALSILENIKKL
jgi:hypothetical protein